MNMEGVCVSGADMQGANLTEAQFSDESDFRDARMHGVTMASKTKIKGDYTRCDWQDAELRGGEFIGAVLDGADFSQASLYYDTLKQAKSMESTIVPDNGVYELLKKDGHNVRRKGGTSDDDHHH